ncbi:hypothetical protein PI124_g21212 [Phytophthora idaei]|nr:hypothetical protein PI125_g13874 [Phytophthora idaei]KAG3233719.1 hypothetical protein PI124_g21212 [Phytophthora idaei]
MITLARDTLELFRNLFKLFLEAVHQLLQAAAFLSLGRDHVAGSSRALLEVSLELADTSPLGSHGLQQAMHLFYEICCRTIEVAQLSLGLLSVSQGLVTIGSSMRQASLPSK